MAQNQRTSPLLRLPAELRNSIYEYALSSFKVDIWAPTDNIEVFYKDAAGKLYGAPHFQALTTTCLQIYNETKLLPIALSEFRGHPEHVALFLARQHFEASRIQRLRLFVSEGDQDFVHNWISTLEEEFSLGEKFVGELREIKDALGPGSKSIVLERLT
jgi:hypothetical protein